MSEEVYKSYEPSKEFIPWTYEKISNQALQGIRWTPFQATCYLSHYDPNDDRIQPGSGHMYSQLFMKLRELFQYLISNKKIILEESCDVMTGNKTMCAENIIYLRHALENGFNDIPDIFMDFFRRQASHKVSRDNKLELDAKNPVLLNDDTIKLYETGKKTTKGLHKAAKAGAAANKEKAQHFWDPLLANALEIAEQRKFFHSAANLAIIVIQKNRSTEINPDTFSKKISSDARIKPLLKVTKIKNSKSS